MSYIDDEELKIDVGEEDEGLEETLDVEDGFSDPIIDDDLEEDDPLNEAFKGLYETE